MTDVQRYSIGRGDPVHGKPTLRNDPEGPLMYFTDHERDVAARDEALTEVEARIKALCCCWLCAKGNQDALDAIAALRKPVDGPEYIAGGGLITDETMNTQPVDGAE